MPQFKMSMTLTSNTPEEAQQMSDAINKILKTFTPQELIRVGKAIDKDPNKIRNGLNWIS